MIALPLVALPRIASAHGTGAEWNFDPFVIAPLLVFGVVYALGTINLWRRAGLGRGIRAWRCVCYASGWLTLAAAVVSPLHEIGERLFAAHMIEHEIIMAVSAPLLALAHPVGAFLWAFPAGIRRRLSSAARQPRIRVLWSFVTRPSVATVTHGAVIWLWHAPVLFDAAVTHVAAHRLQHLSFLVSALAFWWAMLRRGQQGIALPHLFVTMVHTTLLGALLVLSPRALYVRQTIGSVAWGLTPLEDQQLGGLIMWVPGGTIYAGAALACFALWMRGSGAGTSRHAYR
jgi:cytochrome c oxidase assembly factor CtaG